MVHPIIFLVALASWSVNTIASGGGSLLLIASLAYLIPQPEVAPVVTVASLMAGCGRVAISWRSIEWRVTAWYTPGAVGGGVAGAWALTHLDAGLLQLLVGLFLVSAAVQYSASQRQRSFAVVLPAFVPVSIVVGVVSAITGASGLIALPFYLNYGLVKDSLLATRAANSLLLQAAKLAAYAMFGLLQPEVLDDGLIAGLGTITAILIMVPWLKQISAQRFRQLAALMMLCTGILLVWRNRGWVAELLSI